MSDSGSMSGAQPLPGAADDEFDYGMGANNEALAAMRHGLPTAISGATTNTCLDCLLFCKKEKYLICLDDGTSTGSIPLFHFFQQLCCLCKKKQF